MNIRKILMTLVLLVVGLQEVPVWARNQGVLMAQSQNQSGSKIKIYGLVIDSKSKVPLELAQIRVINGASKFVATTRSYEKGKFQLKIEPGTYTIVIIHTGYETVTKSLIIGREDIDLGIIKLKEGEVIQAAGITAESLIRYEGDRISYDVSRDPDRNKINMMAMMEKIPQLRMAARNGKLEFNGEQFEKILIDNEEHGMINTRRQYPMEFIKAGYMRKIEVIMPGSQEYKNEKPLLLITLQTKLPYGLAGQISVNGNTKNGYGSGLDAVANTPVIGIGVGYGYSYAGEPALEDSYEREMSDGTIFTGSTQGYTSSNSHNFNANAFKSFFDEELRFNAKLNGHIADGTSLSQSYANGALLSNTTGSTNSPFRLNASARLFGYCGPKSSQVERKSCSWTLDYSMKNNCDISQIIHSRPTGDVFQSTSKDTKEHRLQIRMSAMHPKFFRKISLVSLTGGWFYRDISEQSVYGGDLRNMSYAQNVVFIKSQSIFPIIDDKLSGSVSVMAEELFNRGESFTVIKTTPLNDNVFNFIPNINLTCNVTRRTSLSTGWSRSVRRPNVSMLSSSVNYTDPNNLRVGNPELKGQVSNDFNFDFRCHALTRKISMFLISTGYTHTNNQMADIMETSKDGTSVSKMINLGGSDVINCSAMISLKPIKKMGIDAHVRYTYLMTVLPSGIKNCKGMPRGVLNFSWDPEFFSLDGELSVHPSTSSFQSKGLKMEPSASLHISKYFKKPHFGISVSASDLLHRGGMMESWIYDTNFTQHNLQERRGRTFMLNLYWRFGKYNQTENFEVKAYDM